ncbi:hypothetical protein KBTX_04376 [wastewater metagenome]|uniref:Uncharacterized protein n=2 Tax=unclassified sequences TaxID=12908 RepID=A0A5B8RJ12_9ZZZZ|nr:hypothetical protein KBTEX_04376 [uncultured organism]
MAIPRVHCDQGHTLKRCLDLFRGETVDLGMRLPHACRLRGDDVVNVLGKSGSLEEAPGIVGTADGQATDGDPCLREGP